MQLTVYHLKSCDTCKKAIRELTAAGHDLELIDVRADGIEPEVLEKLEAKLDYNILMNTKSTTWRALDETEKAGITREKALALMGKYPALVKRPVIVSDQGITVGWNGDIQKSY